MPAHFESTISVIVPVHRGDENFRRCLESLAALSPPPREVIVVSDGDPDGSGRMAEEFGMTLLKLPITGGPARARNMGAKKARGDILFFVDADVTVPPQSIIQIFGAFQHDPDLTAVIGSYDDMPFEKNFISQYKNLFHHYVHQTANREASTFWGACGAIRRKTFLELGGFDERYSLPSIEDIELGYRLKKAGKRIHLLKELRIKHLKRWNVWSLLMTDFFCRALPWTELILKEGRFINDLNIKVSNRISVICIYLLVLIVLLGLFIPWFFVPAVILMVALLGIHRDLYRFFKDKRGLVFAIMTIPWHWLYFFYSGLAFSVGLVRNRMKRMGG